MVALQVSIERYTREAMRGVQGSTPCGATKFMITNVCQSYLTLLGDGRTLVVILKYIISQDRALVVQAGEMM
jgi:hypothetical protein